MSKLKKKFKYMPLSLKEILQEMKMNIDVMFDLAYSAIMFQSRELAAETEKIDSRINEMTYLLTFQTLQATIGQSSETKKLEPIVAFGYSIDKISEALSDIAKVVDLNTHLAQFFQLCWKATPEPIIKVTVGKGTPFSGKKWDDIHFMADYSVEVSAIFRAKHWFLDDNFIINDGDQLIVIGELPALIEFKKVCKSDEPISFDLENKQSLDLYPASDEKATACANRIKDRYIRLTDMSGTMIDLALVALFFGNVEIAEDVVEQEQLVDDLIVDMERDILEFAGLIDDPKKLLGLMRIVFSCELISDATSDIAEHVIKGFETHEVIVAAFSEAWETVVREVVARASFFNGKTVAEVHTPKYAKGFHILAIKRDGDWIYDIKRDLKLKVDDLIIGIGPKETINAWRKQVNPDADIEDE